MQLVLVFHLIGRKDGASYLVQSRGEVMSGRKDITIISIFCHRYFL